MAHLPHDSDFTSERGNGNNGRRFSPPRMVRVQSSSALVHPDSEENVQAQTEDVFLNYIYQSYHNESIREETDSTPPVPELLNFTSTPVTPAAEIGRQLARFGDDINEKYADVFDRMILDLNRGSCSEDPYEDFAAIGRRVFASGINWSRILFLLSFGYRMAVSAIRNQASNFASFLSKVVSFICRFFISERIVSWIAQHGGWRAALTHIPEVASNMFWLISGLAAISVIAVFTLNKFL